MKIFLFGGAEITLGQFKPQLKLIEKIIKKVRPRQVLHIPFARKRAREKEWSGDWFGKHIHLKGIKYLNAKRKRDINQANNPLIFINGGGENANLVKKIKSDPKLLSLVKNTFCIIGESAGAMALGEYLRHGRENRVMIKGLSIIPNTVIEPHYTERKREKWLAEEVRKTKALYGIGIDAMTVMEFELKEFPGKYKKIGIGKIVVLKRKGGRKIK